MYKKIRRIHFIGVGGIGMSGIAELLCRNGYDVSGSDIGRGETVLRLEQIGVRIFGGHHCENVRGAELVVYSSAIRPENAELAEALHQEIPTIPRAEMLAELMRIKYGIAVAGAHGKTTTTSMIGLALKEAELDPTIVVGGRMDNLGGTNARLGSGEFMVVEADESDGSFSKLTPSIAVITNIDREHMDHYGTMRRLTKAFYSFLEKVPFYGLAVMCGDDPYLRPMLKRLPRRKVSYGFDASCDYQLEQYEPTEAGSVSKIRLRNDDTFSLRLQVPGKHNALNALAALAVGDELSISRSVLLETLSNFKGVQRRFQMRGMKSGVLFVDDYAHHPSEMRATLAAARERFPRAKLHVIFQPHRFSRVKDLMDTFAEPFQLCDEASIIDIYAAGEIPMPGIDSESLVGSLNRQGLEHVQYRAKAAEAVENYLKIAKEGDVILTLGAGDLPSVYRELF